MGAYECRDRQKRIGLPLRNRVGHEALQRLRHRMGTGDTAVTDRTSNERTLLDETRKLLRQMRADIFEGGALTGRSQRAGEDLIHRIDAALASEQDGKRNVQDGAPIAYTVQASHDGSYCPPFLFRMDAANYQRQKSEMHPGVTWTIVPLYSCPAHETTAPISSKEGIATMLANLRKDLYEESSTITTEAAGVMREAVKWLRHSPEGKRGAAICQHDYPILSAFHEKHALPSLARPSCLVCGRPSDWPPAIRHAELPNIVVCTPCRDTAGPSEDHHHRYPCAFCGRTFSAKQARTDHEDECEQSPVKATDESAQKSNEKPSASTGDESPQPSPSPVECPKCRTQLAFEGDECGLCKEES